MSSQMELMKQSKEEKCADRFTVFTEAYSTFKLRLDQTILL
jgi:hypothetical protein